METKELTCCDLMVGDWVSIDNKLHKVTGIQICDGIMCVQTDYTDTYYSIENYEPIPLTAEVLEKNGYASYEEDKDSFHDKSCVFIKQKDGGYGVCIDNVRAISGVIHYIHELQQALRLCGVDKEITL